MIANLTDPRKSLPKKMQRKLGLIPPVEVECGMVGQSDLTGEN